MADLKKILAGIEGVPYIKMPFDPHAVKIRKGDLMAIHTVYRKAGTVGWYVPFQYIVIGKKPLGPMGGRSGMWMSGRVVGMGDPRSKWFKQFRTVMLDRCELAPWTSQSSRRADKRMKTKTT